jgi:uncharacterized Zn finger protein
MSVEETWGHFFKPEVRSGGRVYFAKGNLSSSQRSDTEIEAFIRGATSYKVSFKSDSIESELLIVDCTCPASKKGQFCKHIWGTLLQVEKNHPDFLESKSEIKKKGPEYESQPPATPQSQTELQSAFKSKQADYRKQQYQKQKQLVKDQKQRKKKNKVQVEPEFPKDVELALAFFSENGFPMNIPINADEVRLAKKKLSRIFHPDIGGSHAEILALNENFQVLMSFLES